MSVLKGKKQSPEHIKKRVDARRRNDTYKGLRGKNNPSFGKPAWNRGKKGLQSHSEETRKLLSQSHKGKDTWNKGKTGIYSQETLEQMSKIKSGKKKSEETKAKMRISQQKRVQKIKEEGKQWHRKNSTLSDEVKDKIRQARLSQVFPKKDSVPEKLMQLALQMEGIKFEKHKKLPGQPDIFIEPNLCIFVDGDFWHGNPDTWNADDILFGGLKASDIWARDNKITHLLSQQGYEVMRFWTSFIEKPDNKWANHVINTIKDYVIRHQRNH